MIDDHCKNLDFFKGKSNLFNAFHNVNIKNHERVHNWKEVLLLLENHKQKSTYYRI
jgi:5'(3')-deoxyribonucleotidase